MNVISKYIELIKENIECNNLRVYHFEEKIKCNNKGEYTVNINGTLMHKGNDAEEMFEKFQNVIKNNSIRETTSWEYIMYM